MAEWVAEGVVNYLGSSDDVRKEIAMSDCVVLPSYYREGTPRSLLEAAAMGRPIITTDAIGCRDVVDNGVNGYLCNPRDAEDLAGKMAQFLAMSNEARIEMGLAGRAKIAREFDENIVIERYLDAISALMPENLAKQ
jgi:glycosyltransferase involved in cell wall biosynthesis